MFQSLNKSEYVAMENVRSLLIMYVTICLYHCLANKLIEEMFK